MKIRTITLLVSSLVLTACTNINQEGLGVLTGGAVGGLLGSHFGGGSGQVIAATGGAIVGAIVGGSIGKSMDRLDKISLQNALETTQTGKVAIWDNPDSHIRYSVRPTKTYFVEEQPCRDYITEAEIEGRLQQIHGKACRRKDGRWYVTR